MSAELSSELIIELQRAAKLLAASSRICILTGAGISAESGIPTFRDKQTGLWEQYRAEDLASADAFARDPQLVWSWYQWRRQLVHDKLPNPAHYALANWQQQAPLYDQQLTLITQNVDDLHEQAGSTVTHLHGYLWRNRCNQCAKGYDAKLQAHSSHLSKSSDSTYNYDKALINCTDCGDYLRPDIVWFGESLPADAWITAENAAAHCEVFMSIGTSSLVYPAAGLAQLAKQNAAKVIEINPNPTSNSIVDITIAAKAGIVLPLLLEQIKTLAK